MWCIRPINYVKLCRGLRPPAPGFDRVCVIRYVGISLTTARNKSRNSCAFNGTLKFITIFSRASVQRLHKTRIQRCQITRKRLFLEKITLNHVTISSKISVLNLCQDCLLVTKWNGKYCMTVQWYRTGKHCNMAVQWDNRETLQRGSSGWQCNEGLQEDIAAKQFSVVVQWETTGRHCKETVQCGSIFIDIT
jgi:hypothetical protein